MTTTPPSIFVTPESSTEQRSEVQRKLGRCMLRLQQYEMLTKAVLVDHEQSGTMANWQERRQTRVEKFSKLSLGQLLEWMRGSYLSLNADDGQADEPQPSGNPKEIWFSYRASVQMDAASYRKTVASIKELVDLRNELVHHLLERFNIWTIEGCAAADAHLERSYEVIDRHMLELTRWARTMQEANEIQQQFMASEAFLELLTPAPEDVLPTLDSHATIVRYLQDAESELGTDGWTSLDDAIGFISRLDRRECPSRYDCKNWRQVLDGSGVFEQRKVAVADRPGRFTVFRTLPGLKAVLQLHDGR